MNRKRVWNEVLWNLITVLVLFSEVVGARKNV